MKTSQVGVHLIKTFEGRELEAYQDIAGIWTIGYGHTGADVQPGQVITEAEAEQLLKDDLGPRERAVSRLVKVDLNQNEFDALVSFVYNVGENAFAGSTARKRLNRGDRLGAAEALTWWNKATVGGVLRPVAGLTRRRAAERALFITPVNPPIVRDPAEVSENSRLQPMEDSPRRANLAESRTIQGATVAGGAGVASTTIGMHDAQQLEDLNEGEAPIDGPVDQGPADQNPDGATSTGEETQAGDGAPDDAPNETSTDDDASEADPDTAAAEDGDASEDDSAGETGAEDGAPEDDTNSEEEDSSVSIRDDLTEIVVNDGDMRPTLSEQNAADAQIQFALLILIVISVAFIIFTRIDDWYNHRR